MRSGGSSKSGEASTSKSEEKRREKGGGSFRKVALEGLKDFSRHFVNCNTFIAEIQEWLQSNLQNLPSGKSKFKLPFHWDELRLLDFALEGVPFQQLLRMPPVESSTSPSETDRYLAIEDFVHVGTERLWETFWAASDEPQSMPFFVMTPWGSASKSNLQEETSSRGSAGTQFGTALIAKDGRGIAHVLWEHITAIVEVRDDVGGALSQGGGTVPALAIVGSALFHSLQMLSSRQLADGDRVIHQNTDTTYILFVDSQQGGVVRLKGDISKLETNTDEVYSSAAQWIREHAEIAVSHVDQVWNKFGSANWGDIGALQLLLAIFHSIEQCQGPPKRPLVKMAAEHNVRLQQRRTEHKNLRMQGNGNMLSYHSHPHRPSNRRKTNEIEEEEEETKLESGQGTPDYIMKLEPGTILWLEDAHWQRGFQIHEQVGSRWRSVYSAASLDEMGKLLTVYVGAHPSQLEPSWEDMSMWYQVQRQTRVLNIMKQRGISSKFLPQIIASGRLMHPGPCTKQSPTGRCDHPWCGTPVLVTSPVGETVESAMEREGWMSTEEALRCCHDCLAALRSAVSAGIQHGDITPEHVIRVRGADNICMYVLTDWGRAVLEERDSPAVAPKFSSTLALQEGKLCPASDAESLVYLLYFMCGGSTPEFNSMEAALRWRDRVWARRAIQQQLGEVSAILKAFADYVDTLCGTPYPVDYDIWLRRLNRALGQEEPDPKNDLSSVSGRLECVAESSGTSGPSLS